MKIYAARPAGGRPRPGQSAGAYGNRTFSVGVGEVVSSGRQPGAIYRVKGSVGDAEVIDRVTDRLVTWLNDPNREGRSPYMVPWSDDRSVYIVLTPAGKREGWLKP